MKAALHHFRQSIRLPGVRAADLHDFHLDTRNFERLVLPTTKVIRPPSPDVRPGAIFDLEMREAGLLPIHWPGVWNVVEPGRRLVDSLRQPAFPFDSWRHEHLFESTCDGAILTDSIRFRPLLPKPLRWLDPLVATALRAHLGIMFAWRHRVTRSFLRPNADPD